MVGVCKQIPVSDMNLDLPVKVLLESSQVVSPLYRLRKEVDGAGSMEDFRTPEDVKLIVLSEADAHTVN